MNIIRTWWRAFRPNYYEKMGFVALPLDFRVSPYLRYWPFKAFQIVGGKRWSLSIIVLAEEPEEVSINE